MSKLFLLLVFVLLGLLFAPVIMYAYKRLSILVPKWFSIWEEVPSEIEEEELEEEEPVKAPRKRRSKKASKKTTKKNG